MECATAWVPGASLGRYFSVGFVQLAFADCQGWGPHPSSVGSFPEGFLTSALPTIAPQETLGLAPHILLYNMQTRKRLFLLISFLCSS